jgi:CheY-like chemotaxis protein
VAAIAIELGVSDEVSQEPGGGAASGPSSGAAPSGPSSGAAPSSGGAASGPSSVGAPSWLSSGAASGPFSVPAPRPSSGGAVDLSAAGSAGAPEPSTAALASLERAAAARAIGTASLGRSELDELARLLGELRALHGRFRGVTATLRALDDRLGGRSGRSGDGAARRPSEGEELRRLAREGYASARAQLFEHESLLERLDHFTWSLRVLPVDPHLLRHPRAVRDLAVTLGKRVRLDIEEHGARVERPVLEVLDDIAVHLLHNAVDHGIGTPEERARAGKPEVGRIVIGVRPLGAHVELVVTDDGRGIEPQALRRAAVASRALSPEAAEGAADEDLLELLFAPGFTTRQVVSHVSGRGVGLDAVRDRARSIGGTVTVTSTPGVGTTFRALLPARVTMTRVLLATSAGARLAFPVQAVSAVIALPRAELDVLAGAVFVRIDGEPLPLWDLERSMGEAGEAPLPDPAPVLVLSQRGERRAFAVDRVLGTREAVQVPPGRLLEEHAFLRSLALLEDGEIALSLDLDALPSARVLAGRIAGEAAARAPLAAASRATILVVDDSEVTRDVIAEALRDSGFDVREAVDGQQALESIAASRPALLITDLQMPVMDGFALMRAVRENPAWKGLPMIVVSTLGSDADRAQAARAGADAYLVKSDLRREALRDLVSRFVRTSAGGAA